MKLPASHQIPVPPSQIQCEQQDATPDSAFRRALIEFCISLGVILLLQEILLPYSETTRQQIEIGTVLVYMHLWFMFHGLFRSPTKR